MVLKGTNPCIKCGGMIVVSGRWRAICRGCGYTPRINDAGLRLVDSTTDEEQIAIWNECNDLSDKMMKAAAELADAIMQSRR